MRLPDFVIAGAPRSGTTWLATALDRHPDIWMAKPLRPEPKFFLVDESYAEGLAAYSRRWFSDVPAGAVAGEKSTNYLESPTAASRIGQDLPAVRIVVSLRDPVARAISNHAWSVQNGVEPLDLATAVDRELAGDRDTEEHLRYARPHDHVSRGHYARLLRPWLDAVGRERLLVLRFEDLTGAPGSTLARVHDFLGVQARPDLGGTEAGVNPSHGAPPADEETVRRLREHYAPWNEELVELLGPDFPGWPDEE